MTLNTSKVTDTLKDSAQSVADSAAAAGNRAWEYAADTKDRALASGEVWADSLAEQVVRRPLLSVGVALAAGVVLGGLLLRRR